MKKGVVCYVILLALCGSCQQGAPAEQQGSMADTSGKKRMGDKEIVMALLYQQRAAEYRAMCYQCYGLAKERVEEAIRDTRHYTDKSFAVITDLDETALDNSRNEAWLFLQDSAYNPTEFNDWSQHGQVWAVPGSVDFFNFVDRLKDKRNRKITIYYISNRSASAPIVASTMNQMKNLGFPQLVDSQFMFKTSTNSKQPRRDTVMAYHKVIVLLGDNLIDLSASFDGIDGDSAERRARVDRFRDSLGKQCIMFPNAEYGDWEQTLYPNGQYPKTLLQEQVYRKSDLDSIHF